MISLAGYTKITAWAGAKEQALLEAINQVKRLEINYVSRTGKKSRRFIVPRGMYQRGDKLYLVAACEKAFEDRMFLVEGISILPENNFSDGPFCATTRCTKLANAPHALCSDCYEKSQAKDLASDRVSTNSNSQEKRAQISKKERPRCSVQGCTNLAEIRNASKDNVVYRKTCTSCRKGKATGPVNKKPDRAKVDLDVVRQRPEEGELELHEEAISMRSGNMIVEDFDQGHMDLAMDQLRKKLLDVSRRNNLINFKQADRNKRVIRVVDEVPSSLLASLIDGRMEMKPLPDVGEEPADEQTDEFKIALSAALNTDEEYLEATADLAGTPEDIQLEEIALGILKDKVREQLGLDKINRDGPPSNIRAHAKSHEINPDFDLPKEEEDEEHRDRHIQTLLMPDELQRRLKGIYANKQLIQNDKGLNTFYACFGFLKWTEHANSDQENISPLILLPIDIARTPTAAGHSYKFSSNGAEPLLNQTLVEKLKSDLGLELPEFETDEGDDDDKYQIEQYFEQLEASVENKLDWQVLRQVSFGFLNYLDIVIFNDLLPENWAEINSLLGHEIIARLMGGISSSEVGEIDEERDIDGLTLSDEIPHLVMPADSSQHSAIIHALDGKPLVIQGPPGTGKSQTITNLIAALASEGKKVLFLAEKQPALDVVKDRLTTVGLGDIIFDPKVSGDKAEVYSGLERRLSLKASFNEESAWAISDKLKVTITKTNKYKSLLETETNYCAKRLYELIWVSEGANSALAIYNLPYYLSNAPVRISEREIETINDLLQRFFPILDEDIDEEIDLSGFSRFPNVPPQIDALKERAKSISTHLENVSADICALNLPEEVKSVRDIQELVDWLKTTISEYEKPIIDYIALEPEAASSIRTAVEAGERLEALKTNHSFFWRLNDEDMDRHLVSAAKVDEVIENEPGLLSKSKEDLEDNLSLGEDCLSFVRQLASSLGDINDDAHQISFNEFFQLADDVYNREEDWAAHSEALAKLIPERIREETAQNLELLLRQASKLERKLDGLPRNIDFEHVLEHFNADELDDLKVSFQSIGMVGGLFSSSAKRTKQTVSNLGLNLANKEVVGRNLARLADCVRDASALKNSPDIGLNFLNPDLNLIGKSTSLRDTIRSIDALSGLKSQLSPSLQLRFSLSKILEIVSFIQDERSLIESTREALSGEPLESPIGAFETVFADKQQSTNELLAAYSALEMPGDKSASDVFSPSAVSKLTEFFDNKKNAKLSAVSLTAFDDLKRALDALETVEEIRARFARVTGDWLSSTLDKSNQELIEKSALGISKVNELYQDFGSEFFHDEYSEYDVNEDFEALETNAEFFKSIASAETQSLIELGRRNAVLGEVAESLDPPFFKLVRETKENNEGFSLEDSVKLFELRVSQSILRKITISDGIEIPSSVEQLLGGVGETFKALDKSISKSAAEKVLDTVCSAPIPFGNDRGAKKTYTELALIKNELGKQRAKAPIRRLVKNAGEALLALKPVWFLNPVAASQFLPRKNGLFDVVIIDEASQMLPEKAIAAIARGNNLVVVGDNKQMPPTNWLKSSIEFDEEEEEVDAESILDLAQQRVGNSVSLKWHYRSRHPDLIRFSNTKFYDDRLEVFPTPGGSKSKLGVRGVKVEGIYKGQINQLEIQEVIIQARELMERYPDESIGIVAINRPQMERIREALENSQDKIIRDYLENWDGDILNELFVKNLDNVQGDERDNIIISTVYGPETPGGRVMQRFPSVVSMHGHRRLNVLVTRAKNRVILITSLNASDISVDANSPRGKTIFRDYIEYAMTGKLETGAILSAEADSDFEIAVGMMIEEAGYKVTPQVGVKGFRIDLGVTHPDYPHGFIAGVECDGAAFHSSASARDRDSIRQDILESLGWKIYRIWSTDWFTDPSKEKDKFFRWLSSVWSPPSDVEESNVVQIAPQNEVSEVQQAVVSSGPTGQRGEIDIDGEMVTYWKPFDGLYEYWDGDQLIGFTEEEEIEIAEANSSFSHRMASQRVCYSSEILLPVRQQEQHDRFEIGLRWIHRQYTQNR